MRFFLRLATACMICLVAGRAPAIDRHIFDFQLACQIVGTQYLLPDPMPYPIAEELLTISLTDPVISESRRLNYFGQVAAKDLFDLLGDFHNFLRATLNMESFDGRNAPMQAVIGVSYQNDAVPQCSGDEDNATWAVDFMMLPYGMIDYPEVIAHEFTHGLITAGSNLAYILESGALNESISDAVGVTFAAWRKYERQSNIVMSHEDWRMRMPDDKVIRDLRDPGSVPAPGFRYPDHYEDFVRTTQDNGGVHINSSIMNKGFYLLAEGGRHGGVTVEGVGVMKAMLVYAKAGADTLTRNATFEQARFAFADVAAAQWGTYSREWVAVHLAMDAIGIRGYWELPPPPPTQSSPVPAPVPAPDPEPTPSTEPAPTPEPDPAPQPGPDPQPSPQTTADPGPTLPGTSSSQPTPANQFSATLILTATLVGALFALVGAWIVSKRPGRATATSVAVGHPAHYSVESDPLTPGSGNSGFTAPAVAVGHLQSADDTPHIPLNSSLLDSPEGLVIGRSAELCHVALLDARVSRRHVRLSMNAYGRLCIEDLASSQGTIVNGTRLVPFSPVSLPDGAVLSIAGFKYSVRC